MFARKCTKAATLAIVSAVLLLSTQSLSPMDAVGATSCTCQDLPDLEDVAREAAAAIKEYNRQGMKVIAWEQENNMPYWFTGTRYGSVQKHVQNAINSVHDPLRQNMSGDTNGQNCQIIVNGPTACLREFAMTHELVHQKACNATAHNSWFAYQYSRPIMDILLEEMEAYQTSIDLLIALKAGELKDCGRQGSGQAIAVAKRLSNGDKLQQIISNIFK